ncbi:ADP-ribosylglycohydrolase family protein [Nocardia gipuzkoensis]
MRWVRGAFYAGDPERVAAEAVRSAQVTRMHPEGVLGAVAVALAAGRAAHARLTGIRPTPQEFITAVLAPCSEPPRRRRRMNSATGLWSPRRTRCRS